jgi:hypothetical protein
MHPRSRGQYAGQRIGGFIITTGSGSVLLVDLNAGDGVTHSFYKGKPGFGPSESPDDENENRGGSG